jgi:hypothetical protein
MGAIRSKGVLDVEEAMATGMVWLLAAVAAVAAVAVVLMVPRAEAAAVAAAATAAAVAAATVAQMAEAAAAAKVGAGVAAVASQSTAGSPNTRRRRPNSRTPDLSHECVPGTNLHIATVLGSTRHTHGIRDQRPNTSGSGRTSPL